MFDKHESAKLKGYNGPLFPDRIDTVNKICNYLSFNGSVLENVGRHSDMYIVMDRARTNDGYHWFWGLYFKVGSGEVAVLFPWGMRGLYSEIKLDRSIAVYCKGDVSLEKINAILEAIEGAFWTIYFKTKNCHGGKIPSEIFGRITKEGKRIVPKWYVEVRAKLNPVNNDDPFLSWLEAEKWFQNQGWEIA